MGMNESATATLAVESGDRSSPYPDEFRLEPEKSGVEAQEPRTRALVTQLARETSAIARAACINALVRLGAKEGLSAVENALDDEDAAVRLAAVRGTYRLAGREGARLLVRMLHDASEDVRRRAATCLGWIEDESAAVDLLPLLADSSAFVRGAAVDALANLRSSRADFGELSRAVPEITELLNDPVESVRRRADQALQIISGRRMAGTFLEDKRLSADVQAGVPTLVHRLVA